MNGPDKFAVDPNSLPVTKADLNRSRNFEIGVSIGVTVATTLLTLWWASRRKGRKR